MNDIKYWTYDLESYPNFFSAGFLNAVTGERWIFEISIWQDDFDALWHFLCYLQHQGAVCIGYNNVRYDYPMIHHFMTMAAQGQRVTHGDMFAKSERIINAPFNDWSQVIWDSDMLIQQIDLMALMNYASFARATSLKALEVAMRSASVVDLPYKPGVDLPGQQAGRETIDYMCWDVGQTDKFARAIWDQVAFRQTLDEKYGGRNSRVNQTDVKIGVNFLLDKLRERGVHINKNNQTVYNDGLRIADILLPVEFDHPELRAVYDRFKSITAYEEGVKGLYTNLHATLEGLHLDFGAGGLHGAVPSRTWDVTDDPDHVIQLADVESYYPRICVVNGWYPQHLGPEFVHVYDELFQERKRHPKGTTENQVIKIALNAAFGNFGSKYSPLRDMAMMLRITINGQLLLARLVEVLQRVEGLTVIQANTDGIAYHCPREKLPEVEHYCRWWMEWTGLNLGTEKYVKFAQRDVNNYIAVEPNGKVKFKGAYNPYPDFHQDQSSLIVQKAVAAYVSEGVPMTETIYKATDPYDFCLMVKIKRSDRLFWGDTEVQRTCRYYIAKHGHGEPLLKVMPPLSGKTEEREVGINTGWGVMLANDMRDFDWSLVNHAFYMQEARKLLVGLGL